MDEFGRDKMHIIQNHIYDIDIEPNIEFEKCFHNILDS